MWQKNDDFAIPVIFFVPAPGIGSVSREYFS